MPLLYQIKLPNEAVVGIWHNIEGDHFFADRIFLHEEEKEELSTLNQRKRSEWLCSRYLLHLLSGRHDRGACLKDEYGKPYLDGSDFHISISHSVDFTAIIAAPIPCGIDIQVFVDKIARIQSKFVSATEAEYIKDPYALSYLHAIWGAKEAMYKAYGRKELDFKGHIFVEPFTFQPDGFQWQGSVKKTVFFQKYDLFCTPIHQNILVYAMAKN